MRVGAATDRKVDVRTITEIDGAEPEEGKRLQALRDYDLLDTQAEPAFDRITRLAANLFDAPIALVSLVDECRQWFKSAVGLEARETARDVSFCRYVVQDREALVVPDTLDDPRFATNPLVTGAPHMRFYAGAPLWSRDGYVLGTLCVIDVRPRTDFCDREMARLRDLAAVIMSEAELRRALAERDAARANLEQTLQFSSVAIWRLDTRTDAVEWQGAHAAVWGADTAETLTTSERSFARIVAEDRDHVRLSLAEAQAGGHPFISEFRIDHPELGVRWLAAHAEWGKGDATPILTGINFDVTAQHDRADHDNMIMRELHHRMRNLFATIGAILSLTREAAEDVDDYAERVASRLDAMNRAQNVLLQSNFLSGSMHHLLGEVEAAFPRVRWSGPDLLLPENAVVALALIFNELATNAAKHGALSGPGGAVTVSWDQDGADVADPKFRLRWSEKGGPALDAAPDHSSFGTQLMDRSVRTNLGGQIERNWNADGLTVAIELPARWAML